MGYIFPDIATTDVVISLFLSLLFLSFFFVSRTRSSKPQKLPLPTLPAIDHPSFESSLAEYIRAKLARAYAPAHARAHTASEIARYAGDHPLLEILRELERCEYQSLQLSQTERKDLLSRLRSIRID